MQENVPEVQETQPVPPVEDTLPPIEAQDVTDRLAMDFIALSEEFPEIRHPSELPDGVLDQAAQQNIPLLDAYLRHRWQEEKKIASAAQCRRAAANSSAGSLSRGAVEVPPEQDAFLRAFRSAL